MVLGLKPIPKKKKKKVLDRTKALHSPRTQAYGETKYSKKFWTEPRPCMVLGLKPMGKPSTQKKVLDITKALHGPRTQAYGKTNYPDGKVLGSNTVKC